MTRHRNLPMREEEENNVAAQTDGEEAGNDARRKVDEGDGKRADNERSHG